MLHSFFLFLYNLSSLLNKLIKFHSIFSDDYENKYHSEQDINLTDVHYSRQSNKIFVAYSIYPVFLFHPSVYFCLTRVIFLHNLYIFVWI